MKKEKEKSLYEIATQLSYEYSDNILENFTLFLEKYMRKTGEIITGMKFDEDRIFIESEKK
jgi:hypothetical protein